jgi:hypothetical protein
MVMEKILWIPHILLKLPVRFNAPILITFFIGPGSSMINDWKTVPSVVFRYILMKAALLAPQTFSEF